MYKNAPTVALIFAMASPAVAAKGFWVVRGPDNLKCTVVERSRQLPRRRSQGWAKIYVAREEAESGMAVVCK